MTDVAWLTSSYPWAGDTVGGIFFRTQARALARAGLDVTVLAPVPAVPWPLAHLSAQWRAHSLAPRVERDGPVEVVRPRYLNLLGEPSWALPDRFIADAAWRTRDHWSGARLIHGHYSLVGLAAWRLARRAGLPFVLTFHGSDLNTWPDRHPERLEDLRTAVREAAAVFAVSGALGARLRALTGVEAVHLPIGIDHRSVEAAARPRLEARRMLDLPADRVDRALRRPPRAGERHPGARRLPSSRWAIRSSASSSAPGPSRASDGRSSRPRAPRLRRAALPRRGLAVHGGGRCPRTAVLRGGPAHGPRRGRLDRPSGHRQRRRRHPGARSPKVVARSCPRSRPRPSAALSRGSWQGARAEQRRPLGCERTSMRSTTSTPTQVASSSATARSTAPSAPVGQGSGDRAARVLIMATRFRRAGVACWTECVSARSVERRLIGEGIIVYDHCVAWDLGTRFGWFSCCLGERPFVYDAVWALPALPHA